MNGSGIWNESYEFVLMNDSAKKIAEFEGTVDLTS